MALLRRTTLASCQAPRGDILGIDGPQYSLCFLPNHEWDLDFAILRIQFPQHLLPKCRYAKDLVKHKSFCPAQQRWKISLTHKLVQQENQSRNLPLNMVAVRHQMISQGVFRSHKNSKFSITSPSHRNIKYSK